MVIVVCASVGGFALAVIIIVIIIVVAIARARRGRHEAYSLTVTAHAQRASQIGKQNSHLVHNYIHYINCSHRRVFQVHVHVHACHNQNDCGYCACRQGATLKCKKRNFACTVSDSN